MKFLIWSIEHTAWWCAGRMGYTLELPLAGRYDEREAREIVTRANIVKANECLVPLEAVERPRRTADDVGFDEHGQPMMLGAEVGRRLDAIVDHPDAKPVLVVATLNDELGVRVYGPPSLETAETLDHIAATYRQAINTSGGSRQ